MAKAQCDSGKERFWRVVLPRWQNSSLDVRRFFGNVERRSPLAKGRFGARGGAAGRVAEIVS
ncbi:MAG: hypothetical protein KatS3mg105_2074 [Gemmatales bacterium]|nr:MAG: hypothetical protein KatS3mg105_2074 [Gemmatales bacterium]